LHLEVESTGRAIINKAHSGGLIMVNKDRNPNLADSEKPASETMRAGMERAKTKASETIEEAERRGKSNVAAQKDRAAEQAGKLSNVLGQASEKLREQGEPSLARYTEQIASSINGLAERFRERSVDELLRDTRDLARREPTLFLAGSVAVGFAISRFFKASSTAADREQGSRERSRALAEIPDDPEFGAPEPTYGGSSVSASGTSPDQERSFASGSIDKTDFEKKGV
jgi:hypothetical protein